MSAPTTKGRWVQSDQLFRVGFHIDSLPAAKLLSGHVEIHDVIWIKEQDAVLFVVSRKTPGLFEDEKGLRGSRVSSFRLSEQPLLVERSNGQEMIMTGTQ